MHFLRLFEDIALLICHTTRLARYAVSITQSHLIWAVMKWNCHTTRFIRAWEYISLLHQKNKLNWLQNMSCRLDFPFLTLHSIFFWLFFPHPIWSKLGIYFIFVRGCYLEMHYPIFLGSRARFLFFWLFASLSPFIT